MKNGYIHNHISHAVERAFRQAGGEVCREYSVDVCGRPGRIDLRVDFPLWPIACEVESDPRRVLWDIEKARAAAAKFLLILTPTASVARCCRDKILPCEEQDRLGPLGVFVLPLGALPQWIKEYLPLISTSFALAKANPSGKQEA